MREPITSKGVADAVKELRKLGMCVPVGYLECGDAKRATKAIFKAVGLKEKPRPPFVQNGLVGQYFGLDVREVKFLLSNEIRLVGKYGAVIQTWRV